MISVIAHGKKKYLSIENEHNSPRTFFSINSELTEAVTDPISDVDSERAWQDAQGYENADKCAYQYGTMTTFNGFKYNVVQGSRKYLIQQNWSPATPQKCVSSV